MRSLLAPTIATLLLATGCNQPTAPAAADPAQPPAMAQVPPPEMDGHDGQAENPVLAVAELHPTEGSAVSGRLHVARVDGGLKVMGEITGLAAGKAHGFHIHENGDCSAPDGSSAGGHFNPDASAHGRVDAGAHHGGDMPNVQADAQGVALVDGPLSSRVTVGDGSATDIIGRGLIVHADPDDYVSQPTGNAGGRLACAVISAAP